MFAQGLFVIILAIALIIGLKKLFDKHGDTIAEFFMNTADKKEIKKSELQLKIEELNEKKKALEIMEKEMNVTRDLQQIDRDLERYKERLRDLESS